MAVTRPSDRPTSASTRWLRATGLVLMLVIAHAAPLQAQAQNLPAPVESSTQIYDDLLHRYVNDGQVDYPGIAADGRFQSYLEQLATTDATTLVSRAS